MRRDVSSSRIDIVRRIFRVVPNVLANRHFAAGRVWARLLEPKPGQPQSVRLSDQLGHSEQKHKWTWLQQREEFEHTKATLLRNFYLNT